MGWKSDFLADILDGLCIAEDAETGFQTRGTLGKLHVTIATRVRVDVAGVLIETREVDLQAVGLHMLEHGLLVIVGEFHVLALGKNVGNRVFSIREIRSIIRFHGTQKRFGVAGQKKLDCQSAHQVKWKILAGLQNSREQPSHKNLAVVVRTPDPFMVLVFAISHTLKQQMRMVAVIGTARHFGCEAVQSGII